MSEQSVLILISVLSLTFLLMILGVFFILREFLYHLRNFEYVKKADNASEFAYMKSVDEEEVAPAPDAQSEEEENLTNLQEMDFSQFKKR